MRNSIRIWLASIPLERPLERLLERPLERRRYPTTKINLHDVVALKEEIKTQRFPFGGEILLPEGLVGTVVVEHVPGEVFEVEFAGNDGEAFAMLAIEAEKLFLLHFELAEVAAVS